MMNNDFEEENKEEENKGDDLEELLADLLMMLTLENGRKKAQEFSAKISDAMGAVSVKEAPFYVMVLNQYAKGICEDFPGCEDIVEALDGVWKTEKIVRNANDIKNEDTKEDEG